MSIHRAGGATELEQWLHDVKPSSGTRLWAGIDVDGVVLDNRREWKTDLEADQGITPAQLRDSFFAPYWARVVTGQLPLRATLHSALSEANLDINPDELITYWFAQDNVLHPPTLQLLQTVAGPDVPFVLLTNQEHERATFLWDRLAPFGCFDHLLASAAVGHTKKEPAFFTEVTTRLGDRSPRALVDDTVANLDVARAHGWHTFHYQQ